MKKILNNLHFYGQRLTEKELEKNLISYDTLAKAAGTFLEADALYTHIISSCSTFESVHGDPDTDIISWCLLDKRGYNIVREWTNDYIEYYPEIDCYFWAIPQGNINWKEMWTDIIIDDEKGV